MRMQCIARHDKMSIRPSVCLSVKIAKDVVKTFHSLVNQVAIQYFWQSPLRKHMNMKHRCGFNREKGKIHDFNQYLAVYYKQYKTELLCNSNVKT